MHRYSLRITYRLQPPNESWALVHFLSREQGDCPLIWQLVNCSTVKFVQDTLTSGGARALPLVLISKSKESCYGPKIKCSPQRVINLRSQIKNHKQDFTGTKVLLNYPVFPHPGRICQDQGKDIQRKVAQEGSASGLSRKGSYSPSMVQVLIPRAGIRYDPTTKSLSNIPLTLIFSGSCAKESKRSLTFKNSPSQFAKV